MKTRAFLFFLLFLLFLPGARAIAQTRVAISNPTGFQINYKLLFARSSQNFTIPPGRKNVHTTREYPPTFLVDLNVNLRGYPQVKRFRLEPNRTYYFRISGTQLHLLKEPIHNPIHNHTQVPAGVTAKVLVYALGGPQPVYHSSITLYNTSDPYINGQEWSFVPYGRVSLGNIGYMASGKVIAGKPSGAGRPIKVFNLTTQQSPHMAAAIFNNIKNRWSQMPYRALDSNCNHFVNDVMVALGAGRHPVQYQNSWGANVPPPLIQGVLEKNYGCSCGHLHPGPAGGHGHGHGHQPRPLENSDIIREILRRIGL